MEAKNLRGLLAMFLALALAGCTGKSDGKDGAAGPAGPAGPEGPAGPAGPRGADGSSIGSVIGRVTFVVDGKEYPATNVSVTSIPDWCHPTATDVDGEYELGSGCPIGVYTVVFSGNGFERLEVPNVSIAAGRQYVLNRQLVPVNPVVLTAPKMPNPAGFDRLVTLGVTAAGGTPPYTFEWTPKATNPTEVTLSARNVAAPTFTTGTIADIIAGKKVIGFGPSLDEEGNPLRDEAGSPRNEFLGVSVQQLAQLTYNFDVLVKDAMGFQKTLTVAVPTATLAQGNGRIPTGTLVIASFPDNASTLDFDKKPATFTGALNDAAGKYPWFVASASGEYQLGGLRLAASKYHGSNPDCGGCHENLMSAEKKAAFADKFKKWDNSAHGNHFFKYMEYDQSGALVWKKGADGKPLPAPTANPTVFWKEPGAMTTFEFGMTGAEGTHYGANCVSCHTTGYNAAIDSGGFDDVAKAAGWTFPDLEQFLTDLTTGTDPTAEAVTKAPQYAAFDAVPDAAKKYAGMQCESCHGPVGQHKHLGNFEPVGEYSVAACAVCHDRPSNHDRVALWRRSGHANLALAAEEGTADRTSCARCHSAQGYAKYAADTTKGSVTIQATFADVQPQTCAACHDSHATTVRITGENPVYVAGGFYVEGAGTGALCMTCHNGRRGLRGADIPMTSIQTPHAPTQAEVLMGMSAYFIGNSNGFNVSGHAAVAETCVGCHMKTAVSGLRFTNTNHTFGFVDDKGADAATSICAACHGETVNGEAIEAAYESARRTTIGTLLPTLKAAVAGTAGLTVTPRFGEGHDAENGAPLVLAPGAIVGVEVEGTNLVLTLSDAVDQVFGSGVVRSAEVVCAASTLLDGTGSFPLIGADGVVSRALWNLALVEDGSKSIHNPTFVFDVLQATAAALQQAAPQLACDATCL